MTKRKQKDDHNEGLVISYLTLRKAVGIVGMALPFVLFFGYLIQGNDCIFPPSISHYYYTGLGNYFVGTLCAIALFLFFYNGYGADKWVSKLAGSFAILVALFPTNFGEYADVSCSRMVNGENAFSNTVHYVSAMLLFSAFAYFSMILFTKTDNVYTVTPEKKIRNRIYRICGWVIIICIIGIALYSFIDQLNELLHPYKPIFVLETFALLAFGYSWLIKGDTFFKDKSGSTNK